jgi:hypothetical protein
MKKIILFTIIVIILFSIALIIDFISISFDSKQIVQQQYVAEQNTILQSEVEQSAKIKSETKQSEKLQQEADQNAKLQAEAEKIEEYEYKMICKDIEDKYDQIESISKTLISVYKEFGYDEVAVNDYFSNSDNDEVLYEYRSNIESLEFLCYFRCIQNDGYTYVGFDYPAGTALFEYCDLHSEYHNFGKRYCLIYIPDEHLDEESIAILNESFNRTLQNVKDNLFTIWFLEDPF